tara:strand:+ start:1278 stop:1472 length:195 start_codon:yes stop_codon:yes gene_type:complete
MVKWSFPPYNDDETHVCIKICRLNMEQTYCIGCKRSLLEIEQWRDYTRMQKLEIVKELEYRVIE